MQMRKKTIFIIALVLLISITLLVNTAGAKKTLTNQEMVIWELSNIEVVDQGALQEKTAEGYYLTGYTIEAKAKSKHNNVIPEGYFRMTMEIFSPHEVMGSQKPGFWYVTGTWTVTDKKADPETLKVKHNPGKAEGILMAELPFNPVAGADKWTGKAVMQMGLAAGQWSRGVGSLTFRGNQEGDLFLPLERWSEVK